jgi:hypothetical protein
VCDLSSFSIFPTLCKQSEAEPLPPQFFIKSPSRLYFDAAEAETSAQKEAKEYPEDLNIPAQYL